MVYDGTLWYSIQELEKAFPETNVTVYPDDWTKSKDEADYAFEAGCGASAAAEVFLEEYGPGSGGVAAALGRGWETPPDSLPISKS